MKSKAFQMRVDFANVSVRRVEVGPGNAAPDRYGFSKAAKLAANGVAVDNARILDPVIRYYLRIETVVVMKFACSYPDELRRSLRKI